MIWLQFGLFVLVLVFFKIFGQGVNLISNCINCYFANYFVCHISTEED